MLEQQSGVGLVTIDRSDQVLTDPCKGIIRIKHLRAIQRLIRQVDVAMVCI